MRHVKFTCRVPVESLPAVEYWHELGGMGAVSILPIVLENAENCENPAVFRARFSAALTQLVSEFVSKSAYERQLNVWRVAKLEKKAGRGSAKSDEYGQHEITPEDLAEFAKRQA